MSRPHLAILGMAGSGKTTVGSIVAERADLPFLDGDMVLGERTGGTARSIDSAEGTAALHALEQEVARSMLAGDDPAVVAPAASALDDPPTVDRIRARSWLIVLLDAEPAVVLSRGDGRHRRAMGLAEAESRWETRRRTATSIADVVLDATLPPTDLADRIAEIRAC